MELLRILAAEGNPFWPEGGFYLMMTYVLFVIFLCLIVVVAIFWNSRYINALAIVISVFGLKSGAYMYPLLKKIFEKRRKEET